jgi:hypothetical protein
MGDDKYVNHAFKYCLNEQVQTLTLSEWKYPMNLMLMLWMHIPSPFC